MGDSFKVRGLTQVGREELNKLQKKLAYEEETEVRNIISDNDLKRLDQLIQQGYETTDKVVIDLHKLGNLLFAKDAFDDWKDNCLFF